MVGDFIACVKAIAPKCTSNHCIICSQALAIIKIPDKMRIFIDEVKTNFYHEIKATDFRNFQFHLE
jgi:hypothetical protein